MSASGGSRSPRQIMQDAAEGIRNADSFGVWIRNAGIGTVFLTLVYTASSAIQTGFGTITAVFSSLANGLSDLIGGTLGVSVGVIDAGGQAAIESFLTGWASFFGPLAFPAAVGTVIAALWVFTTGFDNYVGFSPLDFIRDRVD